MGCFTPHEETSHGRCTNTQSKPRVGLETVTLSRPMLGEEPVILWHARDKNTLDGLILYQISPVSDCLAAKKVACRLLLGGGEPWPVRFVYTPFFKPLGLSP
jgi:hypothetical protein